MIPRHLMPVLKAEARRNPVVTLVGPRQSGKTTLVRKAFPRHTYISQERPDVRQAALEDPLGFLENAGSRTVLDEVQRAPDLLSYIQVEVDRAPGKDGRFILTGSQNLLLMQSVSQTLAGRTALLTLHPFSLRELRRRPGLVPGKLATARTGPVPDQSLWEHLWRGFYPRIHDKGLDPGRWLADYRRTYVERDLRDVLRVMDLDAFERFLRLAAARTGGELNLNALADDAGISQPTARSWITALRVGSLIILLPPFHRNFRKRLRKRPKLHFLDTGLVCHLLGITSPGILAAHPLRGAIFESFVAGELTKAYVHQGREAPLYHWRDAGGHEIDLILDEETGPLPIEVKAGVTVVSNMLRSLRWWMDLAGNPAQQGLLIHGGEARQKRGDIAVLPWFLG